MDLKKLVIKAIADTDKMAKLKGIEYAEKFIAILINYQKIEKKDDFFDEVFKNWLTNIVSGDLGVWFALLKILKMISKYYSPICDDDNIKLLKLFMFHTNANVSREFIEIICEHGYLKLLPLEKNPDNNEEVKIPSAKDYQESFKMICSFIDDSWFDEYTPAEIGENLAKVLICCKDTTLFNLKLYGTFISQYQQTKKSKSKKKKNKKGQNNLQEVFVYMLKHTWQYLKAYVRNSKVKSFISEKEFEFFKEKEKNMHIEVLESLSSILSTYNVDDPIIEPTLSIFETLEFKNRDSPNDDLAKSVFTAVFKLFDREIIGDKESSELSKIIFITMSRLSQISSLQACIKKPIMNLIDSYSEVINKYQNDKLEIIEETDKFLLKIYDFIMNFNLLSVGKKEGVKFYNLVIKWFTNVIIPWRSRLSSNVVIQMPKCCNSIYVWTSSVVK